MQTQRTGSPTLHRLKREKKKIGGKAKENEKLALINELFCNEDVGDNVKVEESNANQVQNQPFQNDKQLLQVGARQTHLARKRKTTKSRKLYVNLWTSCPLICLLAFISMTLASFIFPALLDPHFSFFFHEGPLNFPIFDSESCAFFRFASSLHCLALSWTVSASACMRFPAGLLQISPAAHSATKLRFSSHLGLLFCAGPFFSIFSPFALALLGCEHDGRSNDRAALLMEACGSFSRQSFSPCLGVLLWLPDREKRRCQIRCPLCCRCWSSAKHASSPPVC